MLKSGYMQRFSTNWRTKYWNYSTVKAEIQFYWELRGEFNISAFEIFYLDYFTILGRLPYGGPYARPARGAPNDRVGP